MAVNEAGGGEKLRYPRSVFFIILNEFCERFSYYGIRTTLSLYFVEALLYSQNTATVIYHTFTMLAYFFPLIGAMLADSFLGKYRTILYLSIVYAAGQLLLSASATPTLSFGIKAFTMLGLLMIALGTGGIKPCVSAFGGDQFKLPQQEAQLSIFFTFFYFAINSGSLISTLLTPELRNTVHCFNRDDCYPLAFFVPSVLMIVSIVIFFLGRGLYKVKKPEGNVIVEVVKCISHGISRKMKSKSEREHWLDHADDKYEHRMIEDIKSVLKVLKLFIPLPFFWALFDQQGSRWTFQAAQMDGEVFGYIIKPDQFQVFNPLFIVILIPVFQWVIYPIIENLLFINTPLRKLTLGGLLAGVSFVMSGIVELQLEPSYVVRPSDGLAQVRIFNTINCTGSLTLGNTSVPLEALGMMQDLYVPADDVATLQLIADYKKCKYVDGETLTVKETIKLREKAATSYAITKNGLSKAFSENIERSRKGKPLVRALIYMDTMNQANKTLSLDGANSLYKLNITHELNFTDFQEIDHSHYDITLDQKSVAKDQFLRLGGVYTIVGYVSDTEAVINILTLADPNSMHMLWLLPQYVVITMGEVMFSITGLEFAFTQAPVSMKSLLQACWLLTVACGNLIVVIIAEAQFFDRQMYEFFLFAGLMFIDMLIFAVMAKFYKYVEQSSNNNSSDDLHLETKQGIHNNTFTDEYDKHNH